MFLRNCLRVSHFVLLSYREQNVFCNKISLCRTKRLLWNIYNTNYNTFCTMFLWALYIWKTSTRLIGQQLLLNFKISIHISVLHKTVQMYTLNITTWIYSYNMLMYIVDCTSRAICDTVRPSKYIYYGWQAVMWDSLRIIVQ